MGLELGQVLADVGKLVARLGCPGTIRRMISADDVAALRYLAIALGAVAAGLVFAAGPESPWVVAVFILAVIVCVLGAIFALRRWGKGREKRPADDERSRSSDPERK